MPEDRSSWSFADLLRWHMRRGTGKRDHELYSDPTFGSPWIVKQFASAVFTSQSSISRWLNGKTVPQNLDVVRRVLFGHDDSLVEQEHEFILAYERDKARLSRNRHQVPDSDAKSPNAAYSLPLQSYVVSTPLPGALNSHLYSCAINVSSIDNRLSPLTDLLSAVARNSGYQFSLAPSVDDLFEFISLNVSTDVKNVRQLLYDAVDGSYAVVYSGSIKSADIKQIGRLPALLKGMAGLSDRQFRVGLFRLGVSLIVISSISATSAYTAWEIAHYMQEFADSTIKLLLHPEDDGKHHKS